MKSLTVTVILLALPLLAACEPTDAAERYRERQARNDPPRLWSAEVVAPERAGPITICADTALREGFARPLPATDGKSCALNAPPTVDGQRITISCQLNGRDYTVRSTVTGDPKTAFDVAYSIGADGYEVAQTRRYRLIGPCPEGWEIGDNTDRQGKMRTNALR